MAASESGRKAVPTIVRIPTEYGKPQSGRWLWTTRAGFESDLLAELRLTLGANRATQSGQGIVYSEGAPTFPSGGIDLTFARQGFRVLGPARAIADCVALLEPHLKVDWDLAVWTPDTDQHNPLAPLASECETTLLDALESRVGATRRTPLPRAGAVYAQVAMLGPEDWVVGIVSTDDAVSLHPGGRARMRVGAERPSRAARKVEEALAWLGVGPGPGELCVDLGAAPGGWTWVLLEKRARVIAVDPAELRPDIARNPRVTHEKASAFQFAPEEPVDWLFCDMAWRPLEVAQLLAKWGRRRWARLLVANLKLPMKTKAETVADLRSVLAGGGWQQIRTRQLYHDREEITLTAHL